MFKLTLRCLERLKMKHSELLACLQKLTQTKISQQTIATLLGVRQSAIGNRATRDGKYSLDELMKIEEQMGFVPGSLSGIQINDNCIEIDYININPSCGVGTVVLDDAEITPVRIGKEIIKDLWKATPENLKLFKASGDSMENIIEDGNVLLVDVSRTDYNNGGIFVLTINNDWFVKRLRLRVTGELDIISDNPKYETETLKPNTDVEIKVVGRVIKNLSRGL